MSVGVMKDYKLKLSDLHVSCTLDVHYESIMRELQRRPIYEYRCDGRLRTKDVGSTRLPYTGPCISLGPGGIW
jgi:hypothetical protein